MNHCSCVVECVDHVVDGRAFFVVCVVCTQKHVILACSHLLTFIARAHAKQLHHKEVQLEDKLPDMFVLPNGDVHTLRQLTDFLYVLRVGAYNR